MAFRSRATLLGTGPTLPYLDVDTPGGYTAGTRFVDNGENAAAEQFNRAFAALAENTDYLKATVSQQIGLPLVAAFTLSSPSNTVVIDPSGGATGQINYTGYLYLGESGWSGQVRRDQLFQVLDDDFQEVAVGGVEAKVLNVTGNPLGSGFVTSATTLTLTVTLPAGDYRLGYMEATDWENFPPWGLSLAGLRGLEEVSGELKEHKAAFVSMPFTLSGASGTIDVDPTGGSGGDVNFTGYAYLGNSANSDMATAWYDVLWKIVDDDHNEVVVNDNIVKVSSSAPAPPNDFYNAGVVTLTLNETLPAGSYRLIFARATSVGGLEDDGLVQHTHNHQAIYDQLSGSSAQTDANRINLALLRFQNCDWASGVLGTTTFTIYSIIHAYHNASFPQHYWHMVYSDGTDSRHAYALDTPRQTGTTTWRGKTTVSPATQYLYDIAWGGTGDGWLVTVGIVSAASGAAMFYSDDNGTTWTDGASLMGQTTGGDEAYAVVYDDVNNSFVAAGNGWIKIASDPTSPWSAPTTSVSFAEIQSLVYNGNGVIMAAGVDSTPDGKVFKSTDGGDTWVTVYTYSGTALDKIVYDSYNDRWIVACFGTYDVIRSNDAAGSSWTVGGKPFSTGIFRGFVCDNLGLLVALRSDEMWWSSDLGVTWHFHTHDGFDGVYDAGYGKNAMVFTKNCWMFADSNDDNLLISKQMGPLD